MRERKGAIGIGRAPKVMGVIGLSSKFVSSLCEQALGLAVTGSAQKVRRGRRPGTEIFALGAAQCAASNRPLPGAETALIL